MASTGKRAGSRKKSRFRPTVLLLALGITGSFVAWGYLVKAAIDFGISARSGSSNAWLFLGVACLGAVACLFVGLMLGARVLRELGITSDPSKPREPPAPPRVPGGRRAAR